MTVTDNSKTEKKKKKNEAFPSSTLKVPPFLTSVLPLFAGIL